MDWEQVLAALQATCSHPRFNECRGVIEGREIVLLRCAKCAKLMQYPDEIAKARATRSLAKLKSNMADLF